MRIASLAAAVALACASSAHADVPLSVSDESQPAYASQDAAATAALEASAHLSRAVEYAGAIFRAADGTYHFTVPVTSGHEREVEGYRVRLARSSTVVALYHTHPPDM